MPLQTVKTAGTQPAIDKRPNSGRRTVVYRRTSGKTEEALVIGPGTNSGVKLRLVSRRPKVVVDDVAKATAMKGAGSTGVYFTRSQ
jgi:hypothetical protein